MESKHQETRRFAYVACSHAIAIECTDTCTYDMHCYIRCVHLRINVLHYPLCDAHSKHNWIDTTHTHGYAELYKIQLSQLTLQSLKLRPWTDSGMRNYESKLFEDDPRQLSIHSRLKMCMQCNTRMQVPISDSQLTRASQPQLAWPNIVRHCTDTI